MEVAEGERPCSNCGEMEGRSGREAGPGEGDLYLQAYEYSNGCVFGNQEFESLMVVVITHSSSLFG